MLGLTGIGTRIRNNTNIGIDASPGGLVAIPQVSVPWVWVGAALAIAFVSMPVAHAQSAGPGQAIPGTQAPGGPVELVFTVPESGVVQASLQGQVTCTITGPAAVPTGCSQTAPLVVASALGGPGEQFVFNITAPNVQGVYHVHFAYTSTLSVPPRATQADTQFVVGSAGAGVGGSNLTSTGHAGGGTLVAGSLGLARWGAIAALASSSFVFIISIVRTKQGPP
jgi:hypothetical protein